MNCDTGHVIRVFEGELPPHGYTFLPAELEPVASRFMGERMEGRVSLTSGGKLSKWAKEQRKARKRQATASKRRNRS